MRKIEQFIIGLCAVHSVIFWSLPAISDDLVPQKAEQIVLDVDFDWTNSRDSEKLASWMTSNGSMSYPLIFFDKHLIGLVPTRVSLPSNRNNLDLEIGISQFLERPLYKIRLSTKSTNTYEANITYPILSLRDDNNTIAIVNIKSVTQTVSQSSKNTFSLSLPPSPYSVVVDFANAQKGRLTNRASIPVMHTDPDGSVSPPVVWLPAEKYKYTIEEQSLSSQNIYKSNIEEDWAQSVALFANARKGCSTCVSPPSVNYFDPSTWLPIAPRDPLMLTSTPEDAEIIYAGSRLPTNTDNEVQIPKSEWSTIVLRKKSFTDCPVDTARIVSPAKQGDLPKFYCLLKPSGD
jgi:hypothetical protein